MQNCPEEFLLWFHHVRWDHPMKSGRTLWEELCHHYYRGAETVQGMQRSWDALEGKIDGDQFKQKKCCCHQQKEAIWWRNACVLYSRLFPKGNPATERQIKPEFYQSFEFPFAPESDHVETRHLIQIKCAITFVIVKVRLYSCHVHEVEPSS
jgi:alpha-glucuronidase